MNELRDKIADILDSMDAIIEATGHDYRRQRDARTDRILALIAEAMLSWDALRAAVDVIDDRTGYHEQEYAHDTISAALQAAGITPGDAREGGEGE